MHGTTLQRLISHAVSIARVRCATPLLPCCIMLVLCGCAPQPRSDPSIDAVALRGAELTESANPTLLDGPVSLYGAGNEFTDFVIHLNASSASAGRWLRISPPRSADGASTLAMTIKAYQILPANFSIDPIAFVRASGRPAPAGPIPQVLLPLARRDDGAIDLRTLRDPPRPAGKSPVLIWVDVHLAAEAKAGDYRGTCELLSATRDAAIAVLPLRLTVHDFILPGTPHLQLVGQMTLAALVRLHPSALAEVNPRLLNRRDPRYVKAVRTLDQLIAMAHEHRAGLVLPELQPSVKWPPGSEPRIDWSDFDSLAGPWLGGEGMIDRAPLAFWPMPSPDFLQNFDPKSRADYWRAAAAHFEENGWLERSPVLLTRGARETAASICAETRRVLSVHPGVRAALPIRDDQLELASPTNPLAIEPASTARMLTASPGLIDTSPTQQWPGEWAQPRHWLQPTTSLGIERSDAAGTWSALAFVRGASMVLWGESIPNDTAASVARDIDWFYPGQSFGVEGPLPTVQLKRLRRAQQDFEYLYLARERGDGENAQHIARLLARPVELQPLQPPEATFELLCGASDPRATNEARQLLAQRIARRTVAHGIDAPQEPADPRTLRWLAVQQRPTVLARAVNWTWDNPVTDPHAPIAEPRLLARVGLDVYNPSDEAPTGNSLQWSALSQGWEVQPQPIEVPPLGRGRVRRISADARVNLQQLASSSDPRRPLELTFVDGFTGQAIPCQFILPVAISERREARLSLDGSLDEWHAADAIQLDRPLVRMLNGPGVRRQQIELADTPTSLFTSWSEDGLHLSFRLSGVGAPQAPARSRNFVEYQSRRASGEDLCEIMVQPLYTDSAVGPTLHVVCKPSGNWVERKPQGRAGQAEQWVPFESTGVRYAWTLDAATGVWRGELTIPWKAINLSDRARPGLLRFNFAQHQHAGGQSASWAGPIDFGRDEALMGLLQLREPNTPGLANTPTP